MKSTLKRNFPPKEIAPRKENKHLMVIWGDCMPLPFGSEHISYYSTYAGLLQKALPSWDIINHAIPRLTISQQFRIIRNDLKLLDPDVSIIHSGMSDLYPHLVSQIDPFRVRIPPINIVINKVHDLYPKTLEHIWLYYTALLAQARTHRHWILELPIIQYTPSDVFQRYFDCTLKLLKRQCAHMIILGIARPGKYLKDRVAQIDSLVSKFNDILKDLSDRHKTVYVDCWDLGKKGKFLQEDSVHLSVFGHKAIFNQIYNYIIASTPKTNEISFRS